MIDSEVKNILILLKTDATRLFERVKQRAPEYLMMFSMKRSRKHFEEIFENRYNGVQIHELKPLAEEVIIALDNFYTGIEEIYWYLKSTEDMPNKIEGHVYQEIRKKEEYFSILMLYIDAELGVEVDKEGRELEVEQFRDDSIDFSS